MGSSFWTGGEYWIALSGVGRYTFNCENGPISVIPDPRADRRFVLDAYRRVVLPLALHARGYEVLHGSGVRTARGVVALCGVSGTGKSTLAYGLSRRGYPLWADDAVAVEFSGNGFVSLALPHQIRLRPDPAALFGEHPSRTSAPSSDHGDPPAQPKPLAMVCLLRRAQSDGDRAISAVPLLPAQAFPKLLTNAFSIDLHNAGRKRQMMEYYLELADRVSILEVSFPSGLQNLSATLDAIERVIQEYQY